VAFCGFYLTLVVAGQNLFLYGFLVWVHFLVTGFIRIGFLLLGDSLLITAMIQITLYLAGAGTAAVFGLEFRGFYADIVFRI